MIVGGGVHPENSIYYLAAQVIAALKNFKNKQIPIFDLYEQVHKKTRISLALFFLSLDWLFLLGAVKEVDGQLEKCF